VGLAVPLMVQGCADLARDNNPSLLYTMEILSTCTQQRLCIAASEGTDVVELTKDEERAISALKRVAATWPKSLWLFSASGTLCVMRSGPNSEHIANSNGGIDPDYIVGFVNIPNDGGDW